jgi:hypothetical protein
MSSTLGDLLAYEIEEPTRYKYVAIEEDRTEPPQSLRFEHEVGRFHRALGQERDAARSAIVKKLLAVDEPDEYIQTALRAFVSSSRPGRLDDAVDILSQCGRLLPQFVSEVLTRPQPTSVDDDYWYVLIRSIGKSTLPSARLLVELLWSRSPEAAVEALGDIGDAESLKKLRVVAAGDPSEFVRSLATEVIEECSE